MPNIKNKILVKDVDKHSSTKSQEKNSNSEEEFIANKNNSYHSWTGYQSETIIIVFKIIRR